VKDNPDHAGVIYWWTRTRRPEDDEALKASAAKSKQGYDMLAEYQRTGDAEGILQRSRLTKAPQPPPCGIGCSVWNWFKPKPLTPDHGSGPWGIPVAPVPEPFPVPIP
jgi:hypothetical protein